MVADLVHENMSDDIAELFVMLGPIVEDRAAIEQDHSGDPAPPMLLSRASNT